MSTKRAGACLLAGMLIGLGAGSVKGAAPLQAQLVPRPLTPGDKSIYSLPSALEVSGGMKTVPVGAAVYLDVLLNNAIPAADITGVTWGLTTPLGSLAALTNSPLGSNVPVYEPADRVISQVADRKMLRADLRGQYTVTATVTTASEGTTNLTLTLTAGTYMGLNTCALCHSGGVIAQDRVHPWETTAHSTIFSNGVNGYLGHYSQSCLACHTVGYDTATNAVNGGFDDVMRQTGWIFPPVQAPTNWSVMPPALQNLANIQCENCHGPGSEHAYSLGDTNLITRTVASGDCNQCHDAPTHHIKGTEWYNSMHAVTTRDPSGPGRDGCVGCHTSDGFIARISGGPTNLAYSAIGCQTCHEPHGITVPATNSHLLRTLASVTLMDGTVVSGAGNGLLCMNCHRSRQNATNYVEVTTGSSRFGPHHGPQADMFMGVNAVTYGKSIPSSAHKSSVADACVTCHMQTTQPGDPAFLLAGGHTFNVSYSNGATNLAMTAACAQCHGAISTFNLVREDYNGDGIIEGVQTEVQKLMDQLALMLPPVGVAKSTISIDATWTRQQLRAGYNYLFVQSDGSRGVHNVAYAVGILKASIADLSGVSVPGGLPDWWVVRYFGSTTNLNAAPNANPTGDGVPNWVKYALGLNPLIAGTTNATGGVVWADGNTLGTSNPTNTIAIYKAAEVAFDTELGKTYQVLGISSLSEGWQPVSALITGTGAAFSYLTPTRQNVQQFFRVVHTP